MSIDDFSDSMKRRRQPTGGWRDGLAMKLDGTPLKNLYNACVALRDHPQLAGRIAYDEFHDAVHVRGPLPWDRRENRQWTDFDDLAATEWLQGPEVVISVGTGIAREAVQRVAWERRFHPVLEWLESLEWDGTERVSKWLTTYLGAADTDLNHAIGRKFLISAVARVMRPGCKVDHMLILEGPQGGLKSTALRTLAGEGWFTDHIADLGTKDSSQDLRGVWIIELSELSAIRASEVEKVKAYVSRQTDHYRPSYGRRVVDVPRQTVFCATTNAREFLNDSTGGRRFWLFTCGRIDVESLAQDRERLWAEAVAAYHAGERWWLDDDELREAMAAEQESRRIADPWEPLIAAWLDDPREKPNRDGACLPLELGGRVTVAQILEHAIVKPAERQGTADQMRVGRVLRLLGWQKRKPHRGSVVWESADASEQNADTSQARGPRPNGQWAGHADTADTADTSAHTYGTHAKHHYRGTGSAASAASADGSDSGFGPRTPDGDWSGTI